MYRGFQLVVSGAGAAATAAATALVTYLPRPTRTLVEPEGNNQARRGSNLQRPTKR